MVEEGGVDQELDYYADAFSYVFEDFGVAVAVIIVDVQDLARRDRLVGSRREPQVFLVYH